MSNADTAGLILLELNTMKFIFLNPKPDLESPFMVSSNLVSLSRQPFPVRGL